MDFRSKATIREIYFFLNIEQFVFRSVFACVNLKFPAVDYIGIIFNIEASGLSGPLVWLVRTRRGRGRQRVLIYTSSPDDSHKQYNLALLSPQEIHSASQV